MRKQRVRAEDAAEERILDVLIPPPRTSGSSRLGPQPDSTARQGFRKKLREGQLDDQEIEIDLVEPASRHGNHGPGRHGGDGRAAARHVQSDRADKRRKRRSHRRGHETADRRGGRQAGQRGRNQDPCPAQRRAERHRLHRRDRQGGLAQRYRGAEVSRQGVQRDLLPLVEGTTVHQVRHGQDRPHPVHRQRARFTWPNRAT
jgi:ATP-dependent HslUV protease ATP-binding subunit HslU